MNKREIVAAKRAAGQMGEQETTSLMMPSALMCPIMMIRWL